SALAGAVYGDCDSRVALALGVGDIVLALETSIYAVISPEGAAASLCRSATGAERAAQAMRLAAPDLLELGVVDALIPEPAGGAHTDHDATTPASKTALLAQLDPPPPLPDPAPLPTRY